MYLGTSFPRGAQFFGAFLHCVPDRCPSEVWSNFSRHVHIVYSMAGHLLKKLLPPLGFSLPKISNVSLLVMNSNTITAHCLQRLLLLGLCCKKYPAILHGIILSKTMQTEIFNPYTWFQLFIKSEDTFF